MTNFRSWAISLALLCCNSLAIAASHEVRLTLHAGKIYTPDLAAAICRNLHLPRCNLPGGYIDVSSLGSSLFLHAIDKATRGACQCRVEPDALVLKIDPEKFPHSCDEAKSAARIFTAEMAPQATARQARRWGLFLPAAINSERPLVILVHGLDSEKEDLSSLGDLIDAAGYQVGYFSYPDDQPIADSAELFGARLAELHTRYPSMQLDIVAHSMGGLVARAYIEGSSYTGGVDRLFLVGTPNHGSGWAAYRFLLEMKEQYQQWRHVPGWSWTWSITDGLGEAGRDLKPHSKFLDHLNSLPRRAGVRYTIIAGAQHPASGISANIADATASAVPTKTRRWWGLRHCKNALSRCADHFRHKTSTGDGPVQVESAELAGVSDVAILPADHLSLVCCDHGSPPAAWTVIADRLKR